VSFHGKHLSILPAAMLVLLLWTSASGTGTAPRVATPAPPGMAQELAALVEQARLRFVAKDAAGVLAHVADNYRSGGLTKPDVRQQLLALHSSCGPVPARARGSWRRRRSDAERISDPV